MQNISVMLTCTSSPRIQKVGYPPTNADDRYLHLWPKEKQIIIQPTFPLRWYTINSIAYSSLVGWCQSPPRRHVDLIHTRLGLLDSSNGRCGVPICIVPRFYVCQQGRIFLQDFFDNFLELLNPLLKLV